MFFFHWNLKDDAYKLFSGIILMIFRINCLPDFLEGRNPYFYFNFVMITWPGWGELLSCIEKQAIFSTIIFIFDMKIKNKQKNKKKLNFLTISIWIFKQSRIKVIFIIIKRGFVENIVGKSSIKQKKEQLNFYLFVFFIFDTCFLKS